MKKSCRAPAVSVVIPSYNARETLAQTLDCVAGQAFADFEAIIVDDGSTDGSDLIAAARAQTDPRFRLITQPNAGVSAARNTGIRAAQARLVALLDADDLWAPDHLAAHQRRFTAEPRLGISFSAARFIDAAGRVVGQSRPKLRNINPRDLLFSNPATTCSTLVIHRDVFRDVGLFRTEMRHNEDQEWLFRVTLSGWLMAGDATPRVDHRTGQNRLGADLDATLQGFENTLAEARKLAPVLVRREEARARAAMLRRLARRAIRLGLSPTTAQRLMFRSLAASPLLALREPQATFATLAAALLPRIVVRPLLQSYRPVPVEA